MRLVILSGLSGSGKSVALHALEDLGLYCVDNIPIALLRAFVEEMLSRTDTVFDSVAVGLDARSREEDIRRIPELLAQLRGEGVSCEVIFLQADDETLLSRFSETRRKHPLTTKSVSLPEAVSRERDLLGPVINSADLVIDTTHTSVLALRERIRDRVAGRDPETLSILVESFGYKHGLPADADFVFDVRSLPNPYWEPQLRPLSGKDPAVRAFLNAEPRVQKMIKDIVWFLEQWIPSYRNFQRSYLTVAIGCTGGQHRSVYVVEEIAKHLAAHGPILTRHHELL